MRHIFHTDSPTHSPPFLIISPSWLHILQHFSRFSVLRLYYTFFVTPPQPILFTIVSCLPTLYNSSLFIHLSSSLSSTIIIFITFSHSLPIASLIFVNVFFSWFLAFLTLIQNVLFPFKSSCVKERGNEEEFSSPCWGREGARGSRNPKGSRHEPPGEAKNHSLKDPPVREQTFLSTMKNLPVQRKSHLPAICHL